MRQEVGSRAISKIYKINNRASRATNDSWMTV